MDHTENTLRGVVKALTDVVAPALNPADALANEQLRLAVDYLQFVRARLDLLYERERFELGHYLRMGRPLRDMLSGAPSELTEPLNDAITRGEGLLNEPGTAVPDLRDATAKLAAAIRNLLRSAQAYPAELRRRIETWVVEATDERIAFERSWYLPLGFDPAPTEVEPVAEILARSLKG